MNIELIALTDDSGSMSPLRPTVIKSYNSFVLDQLAAGRVSAMVTHALFNNTVRRLYEGLPLLAVPRLSDEDYRPGGGTALFDALGETLSAAKARIDEENWADHVLCAITTDGEERDSVLWSESAVQDLVRSCMDAGWEFLFLGAGPDALRMAKRLKFDPDSVHDVKHSKEGIEMAFKRIAGRVLQLGYSGGNG